MGMYVLNMGGLGMVLIGIVFYGGLMVVTMLIVMPNGNAHYYYSGGIIVFSVVTPVGSVYIRILTVAILILILIL